MIIAYVQFSHNHQKREIIMRPLPRLYLLQKLAKAGGTANTNGLSASAKDLLAGMRGKIFVGGALIAVLAFGPQAHADVIGFGFNGDGTSGSGFLTIAPNVAPADPNSNCGTAGNNPCRTDPVGAYAITGITGTFSDARNGISNALITGVVPINPGNERNPGFDPLVPSSLSFIDYAPPTGYLTYNNLFFPNGSPIDCDFPYTGTFVDVFGLAFTVAGGYTVDLWGDGDMFGPGTTTYGVAVTDGSKELAYQFAGATMAVPEPSSFGLLGTALLGLGVALRRRRKAG